MRTALLIALGAMLAVAGNLSAAQRADTAKDQADMSTMIDDMAKDVFKQADGNRNGMLSRREFENAETLLGRAVTQWGQNGLIGKPKPGKRGNNSDNFDSAPTGQSAAEAKGNKLAKAGKVTQAEFTFYAHAVVSEADQMWRQYHQMSQAQQKAYNAQRQLRSAVRRRRVVVTPFGYFPNY